MIQLSLAKIKINKAFSNPYIFHYIRYLFNFGFNTKHVKNFLCPEKVDMILDVGCGIGYYSKIIDETLPVTDYWWKSQAILYVILSVGSYSNPDSKASGELTFLYPNSGMTDSRTRFTVQVY